MPPRAHFDMNMREDTGQANEKATKITETKFFRIWPGQFLSQLGSSAHAVGVLYLLKEVSGSSSVIGSVLFISAITGTFLVPIGGVISDKYSRAKVAIVCDVISGTSAIALALIVSNTPHGSIGIVIVVAACGVLLSACAAFFRPAFGALLPDIVPNALLPQATAMYRTGSRGGDLIGVVSGGLLYAAFGPVVLFVANGISFFFGAWFSYSARIADGRTRVSRIRSWRFLAPMLRDDLVTGWRNLRKLTGAKEFITMAWAINFLFGPIFVLLPFHLQSALGIGSEGYSLALGALYSGMLLGYLAAGIRPVPATTRVDAMRGAVVVMCVSFIAFALSTSIGRAATALFVAGAANGFWSIHFEVGLQSGIPTETRGRIMGIFSMLMSFALPVGYLVGGALGDITGQQTGSIFVVCALLMTVSAIVMTSNRRLQIFLAGSS